MRNLTLLALFLLSNCAGFAQIHSPGFAASAQIQPSAFHISVVDGEGALNNIQSQGAREPVILVEDKDHKPVAGAYVEFDTPNSGAGATFANGSTHFATTTNAEGLATASGLKNNGITGPFAILAHVSFQGQSIGEISIHQNNIPRKIASISSNLQGDSRAQTADLSLSASVLGIALGDQFIVNGAATPSNANLLRGTRLQTINSPTSLYVHDRCEFLVGPHSSVTVQPKLVSVETGAVRAKHFGDCKLGYGGLWISGTQPNADGVISITGDTMQVGSVSGDLQIVNTQGELVGSVASGSVSSFGQTAIASGASAGAPPVSGKTVFWLGAGVATTLFGLGLAVTAILQPASTSP